MRLKISIHSTNNIILPFGYFSTLQGFIYSLFDRIKGEWLHNEGFRFEKRKFKLFVFSEIMEKAKVDKKNKMFIFPKDISFYFASPVRWICEQLAKNLIFKDEIKLANNFVRLNSIEIKENPKIESNKIMIKTLSPIEIHSTLKKDDGTKKTYYYSSFEKKFSELINKNLQKKWKAFYKEECKFNVKITPQNSKKCKQVITIEKGIVIKGWKGNFILQGDIPLIRFAFDVGLGNRNSLGFGMIDVSN